MSLSLTGYHLISTSSLFSSIVHFFVFSIFIATIFVSNFLLFLHFLYCLSFIWFSYLPYNFLFKYGPYLWPVFPYFSSTFNFMNNMYTLHENRLQVPSFGNIGEMISHILASKEHKFIQNCIDFNLRSRKIVLVTIKMKYWRSCGWFETIASSNFYCYDQKV